MDYTMVVDSEFMLCEDCVGHQSNGESGCCHNPEHERFHGKFGIDVCEVAKRTDRKWRRNGIQWVTLDSMEPEYSTRSCDGCGSVDDGDRWRASATSRHIAPTHRKTYREGTTIDLVQYGGPFRQLVVEIVGPYGRKIEFVGAYSGAGRYLKLAQFLAENGV